VEVHCDIVQLELTLQLQTLQGRHTWKATVALYNWSKHFIVALVCDECFAAYSSTQRTSLLCSTSSYCNILSLRCYYVPLPFIATSAVLFQLLHETKQLLDQSTITTGEQGRE